MPTYHFQLNECGDVTIDDEGQDLPDIEAAHAVAIKAAREVMCAEVAIGHLCMACSIIIEDVHRHELGRVPFRDAVELAGL